MKKRLRTISIQFLITIAIIAALEFVLALFLDVKNTLNRGRDNEIHAYMPSLPNYSDVDWAQKYWEESGLMSIEYRSYEGWRYKPFHGETINVDSSGIRITSQAPKLKVNSSLAFFLGGSTMWGVGVRDEKTIPSIFGENQATYSVKNISQIAYSAYQNYLTLQHLVFKGETPGLVISYDGVNDSPLAHEPYKHMLDDQFKRWMENQNTEKEYYSVTAIRRVADKLSGAFNKPDDISVSESGESPSAAQNEASAIELLESWLLMKRLCDDIGAKFICILQPNAFYSNPDISNLLQFAGDDWHFEKQKGYAYYNDVFRLLEEEHYASLKPHFQDYSKALDKMPNVYIDYCHLSHNGNELIANKISAAVF